MLQEQRSAGCLRMILEVSIAAVTSAITVFLAIFGS